MDRHFPIRNERFQVYVHRISLTPRKYFYFLSIHLLRYIFLFPYFTRKIILLPLHLVVNMPTCILHLLIGRIYFCYFVRSHFLYCYSLFWYLLNLSTFVNIFWFICITSIVTRVSFVLVFSSQYILEFFFLPSNFLLLSNFHYQSFKPNFPSRFWISIRVPDERTDFITD